MPEVVKFDTQALLAKYLNPEHVGNYYELLMQQNKRVNLVSRETKRADFDRLVAESLLPLGFLPEKINGYLDIGSGGGFPSVPILMSGAVNGKSILVERTGKKAGALEQIVKDLGLKAQVVPLDFGEVRDIPQIELVTLRYVKLTSRLLTRIMSRVAPGGKLVYYSTPDFEPRGVLSTTHEFESPQASVIKSFTIFSR